MKNFWLILFVIAVLGTCIYAMATYEYAADNGHGIRIVEFEGHEYIVYRGKSITHNENCKYCKGK